MTLRLQIAFLLCLTLLAPTSLRAQFDPDAPRDRNPDTPFPSEPSTPNRVQGQVVADDPSGLNHPIRVQLESFQQVIDTAFTDGNGNFRFDNAAPRGGNLFITIDEPGYEPLRHRVEDAIFASNSGSFPVVVVLTRSEDTDRDSSGASGVVDLNQLTRDIPEEAVEAFRRAADESQNGNYERSAQHLEEAVEIAPEFYEAQNALGVEYQRLGRLDDAIARFEIAMDLNPNAAPPVLSLGILYLQDTELQIAESKPEEAQASVEKAFTYLEEAVDRDATSATAQYYFGAVLHRTGNNDQALDRLNRALALNEEMYAVRLMLFNVYLDQRDYPAALDQLATYLSEYPESPQREAIERIKAELEQQLSQP